MTHPVSLPSIHEMFPAHLLRPEDEYIGRHKYQEAAPRTRCSSYPPSLANNNHHTTNLGPTWSTPAFRVSVPPTAAVHHRPSSSPHSRSPQQQRTDPDPAVPTMISFPVSASKPSPAEDASDEETPGESAGGKKHICPTCLKRFNRPSSLRIHVNTHTGATPFRCPWPSCGREFNVNSNMRRHYRNHTTPGFSRAQPPDSRRKRRRVDTLPTTTTTTTIDRHHHQANLMPPISHFSPSDDSDEYDSDTGRVERGERVEYRTKAPAYNLTQSMARVAVTKPYHHHHHHHHDEFPPYGATSRYHQQYPDSASTGTTRSFHSSSSPSSSSSSLPSPLLQPTARHHPYPAPPPVHSNNNTKRDHKYNPSAPYMHSLADTRVSTALRPAYHS